jgi:glycerophosphoryl diester phosphodiesterase
MLTSKKSKISAFVVVGLICYFIYLRLTAVDLTKIENLNSNKIDIISHAGGFPSLLNPTQLYPSNSLQAIKRAVEDGAEGLEVDIQMTKDSVLVLYHDQKLDSETNGEGCIPEKSYEDISKLKYRLGFPFDWFQDEGILRFDELVTFCKSRPAGFNLYLDFHGYNYCNRAEGYSKSGSALRQIVKTCDELEFNIKNVHFISGNGAILRAFQRMDSTPNLVLEVFDSLEVGAAEAQSLGLDNVITKSKLLSFEGVRKAHNLGVKVHTFGVKSRLSLSKIIEMNVDGIQTDNTGALIDLLR